MIKSLVLGLIGKKNAGRLDYLLGRKSKTAWGPLNAQSFRQRVYLDIMSRIKFDAIVETGTFRGTTTDFFAKSGLPVYSVELDPRAYGYASLRFFNRRDQVHLFYGNSPEFLRDLANDPHFPKSKVFFYLDAHVQDSSRYHKAPLTEELEIIFTTWTESVVMVDDFQVPGTDYGFDNWGPGKTLNLECLELLNHLRLWAFFPALSPEHETGAKRGWVVLCREANVAKTLSGMGDLTTALSNSAPKDVSRNESAK
jgi:hypothetical protein